MRHLIAIVLLTLVVAACGDAGDDGGAETTAVPASETEEGNENAALTDPTTEPTEPTAETTAETTTTAVERSTEPSEDSKVPETVPEETSEPVVGETPTELMAEIKADLLSRTGAAESDVTLVRGEEAVWNDGSLGCPEPGQMYTQALVSGYWIVFDHAGQTYDYRASGTGFFKLCEAGGLPPSNPTG